MLIFQYPNRDSLVLSSPWAMYLLWDRFVTNITVDNEGVGYNTGGTPSVLQFHTMDFIRLYVKDPTDAKEKLLPAKREWI